jgi:hypothetical protein
MPFPSNSGTTQISLSDAWTLTRSYMNLIKTNTQQLRTASETGNVNAEYILTYATKLIDYKVELQKTVNVTGLAAYAQEQINNPTINIVTEYNAVIQALDSVVAWIINNMPKDQDGYLLITQFAAQNNGRTTSRSFAPAQTAGLRTTLDSLLSTID